MLSEGTAANSSMVVSGSPPMAISSEPVRRDQVKISSAVGSRAPEDAEPDDMMTGYLDLQVVPWTSHQRTLASAGVEAIASVPVLGKRRPQQVVRRTPVV